MGYLPDVNVVNSMSDNDNFVIQQGNKTRQISKANALDGLDSAVFADVIDATASNYTLVPQSDNPVTIVRMDGATGALTIPSGSFTEGAIYVVNNESDSDYVSLDSSAVTVINDPFELDQASSDAGNAGGTFVFIGSDTWIAYGDFVGEP